MATAPPEIVNVVTTYARAATAVRGRVLDFVDRAWVGLDAYRDADVARFAAAVAPVVEAGQVQTAAIVDAYLAAYESAAVGGSVAPVGVPREAVTALRGIPTAEAYRRAGPTVWTALANGRDLTTAVEEARQRVRSIAATDVQLAKTHAARRVLDSKGNVVGYRRTLTGNESCGLCLVASTQRYRKSELMPVHPGCDCGVQPIYGDADPGQVIDPDRLEAAHASIAARFGKADESARTADYRSALVTHEHGEIGPVLAVRNHKFTSAADLG